MATPAWWCVVVTGVILLGCGGTNPGEKESSSKPSPIAKAAPQDLQAGMKQPGEGYSFQVKDGTEDLMLQAGGTSGDSYSLVVNNKDGAMKMSAGNAAKIPEAFPQDIPLYPGMNLSLSQFVEENQTFSLQATSADPIDKIFAHFKTEVATRGWIETTNLDQNEEGKRMCIYACSKEDRVLNILLATGENGTSITLITSQQ